MQEFSKEELNRLHGILLEMFSFLHTVCVENNIRYYALGGTMLGAARHQGFIPWDDDVDVGMPRNDYDQFISIVTNLKDSRYVIESADSTDDNYCYAFAKLYDTQTTLIENKNQVVVRGVFIDIFPLDGYGETLQEAKIQYKKVMHYDQLLMIKRMKAGEAKSAVKNVIVSAIHSLPFKSLTLAVLRRKVDHTCRKMSFDNCKYIGNPLGAWRWKEIMERRIMGTPRLYKFEDIEIFGSEFYDDYLKTLYGDWTQLPPAEKRKSHHDYHINMDLPYEYYKIGF